MKGWIYILKCADDTYYTGSTNNILLRIRQHNAGIGSNYTAKRLPVELIYLEEYSNVADAFYREKQIQGWSRRKKEALMKNDINALELFSVCYNEFECAIQGINNRFTKKKIESIKNFKNFLPGEIDTTELLNLLAGVPST
jgi:putative endonuclease